MSEPFTQEQKDAWKNATKEAIKEFLQEKWAEFSGNFTKWALGFLAAAALGAIVYLIAWANGWKHP